MNRIMCELLRLSGHKRKSDNKPYYSVTVLINNRISLMFFNDRELFDELSKLERLTDICLIGELRCKDDTSFMFVPQGFEI